MGRLSELVAPRALDTGFRWLWGSSAISNLGDGVLLAAGPLLVASVTTEPIAVAAAVFLQRLPWLLFGVFAGALIDRLNRKWLTVIVDLGRAVVLGALAGFVATGSVNLAIIYVAMFLIGTAETFADNAAQALLATNVPRPELGRANARLFGTVVVTNQLAGPPLGALLFGVGMAVPFGVNALCFVLGAALVSRIRPPAAEPERPKAALRHEVVEGLRWLWAHKPVRTLALTITAFNVTFGAAFAVLVLYAQQRLALGAIGFGVLMTASAVGGLLGSGAYGMLERRFGLATLMRAGLVIETLTHLALALSTDAILAGVVLGLFGMHAVVWGTTSTTVRQRAVPSRLLGRVTSVYMIGSVGALALGTLLGGVIAQQWGITAPFWFAFAGSAVITVVMWRSFANIVHEEPAAEVARRLGDPKRPFAEPPS